MTEPQFVFVYGLLMRGMELHRHMESGTFAGTGRVAGSLVSLGQYPALIEGSGTVRGELYRFEDLPAALDVLDDIEEFDPTDPDASLYLRVARRISKDDGGEVDAWVYLYNTYNTSTNDVPRIASGDWRKPE